eukprot:TRINITY_DN38278_c0_g1_i1.p1 TRINITY_DN38278_c0_g1~~TRINITY_DN38278_c0_g1_i1.p1  ORF type:complete len:457 (-),score=72.16 TRINITY_DN38278_c0_g1_i1:149-1519(-)
MHPPNRGFGFPTDFSSGLPPGAVSGPSSDELKNVERMHVPPPVYNSYYSERYYMTQNSILPVPISPYQPPMHVGSSREERINNQVRGHSRERPSNKEGYRNWIFAQKIRSSHLPDKFVVMTYNILGEINASKHKELYESVPPSVMEWTNRKRLIFQEVCMWKPDVMCLQEVDHFEELVEEFQKIGYSGIFKGRTGEAQDGCAMFWKTAFVNLLEEDSIEFNEYDLRNNVAQICVFEVNKNPQAKRVVIANTHLLFNPKRGDIKLGQVRILLNEVHFLSRKWGDVPVVISGDFNATPQSALYKFLANSTLNLQKHNREAISGQMENHRHFQYYPRSWSREELQNATGKDTCKHLQSPMKLFSAYAAVKAPRRNRDYMGEPLVTTYHSNFIGTVDYIWYSNGLIPVRILDTLPLDVLRNTHGLPTNQWGSDHLCLVCELAFLTDQVSGSKKKVSAASD